jgi:predicted nucleic acid-binding protein
MRDILIDADAFRILHGLKLLDEVLVALHADRRVVLTGYVARHELALLGREVERLEKAGVIVIVDVRRDSDAGRRYRIFQRETDKGEAEAIAWALDVPDDVRPLFVSRDAGARRFARAQGVPETDVMGAIVEAVHAGRLPRERAQVALAVWEDKDQQIGRPSDYAGFDATFAARESERLVWSATDPPPQGGV